MKTLKELSDQLKQFDDLPKDQKNTILALIDLKTELDMKEVISRFDSMQSEMQSEMKSMQSEMQSEMKSMQFEMRSMQSKFVSRFDWVESKFDSKFNILLWIISAIGLMITIIGLMITVFKFLW